MYLQALNMFIYTVIGIRMQGLFIDLSGTTAIRLLAFLGLFFQ